MKRGITAFWAMTMLAAIPPVFAGTVFVPVAIDQEVMGNHFRTEIRAYNDSGGARRFSYSFVELGDIGTENASEPVEVMVGPRRTERFDDLVPPDTTGFLEISAEDDLYFTARLIGTSADGKDSTGVELRVVTARDATSPGVTSVVPGLMRSDTRVADYFMFNLSTSWVNCAIDVFRRGGNRLYQQTWSFPPYSLISFPDALRLLGVTEGVDFSIAATCDELSYPFAMLHDLGTAQLLYVSPAGSGLAGFQSTDPQACSAGATCVERSGNFFTPTRNEPVRRITMNVPEGIYSRIHLRMDVLHGGWLNPSSGLHNIFWLALNGNKDMVGYVNLLGPGRNRILMRHGFGLVQEQKPKLEKPFQATPGETYTFDYVYDTALGTIELQIFNRGEVVASISAAPNVNRIDIGPNDKFLLDISFTGSNPNEPATYGWRYQNLFIEYAP